jgi:hypothetical protein
MGVGRAHAPPSCSRPHPCGWRWEWRGSDRRRRPRPSVAGPLKPLLQRSIANASGGCHISAHASRLMVRFAPDAGARGGGGRWGGGGKGRSDALRARGWRRATTLYLGEATGEKKELPTSTAWTARGAMITCPAPCSQKEAEAPGRRYGKPRRQGLKPQNP